MKKAIIVFRRDLRLGDNPALCHATREGYAVIPVFIRDTEIEKEANADTPGAASRWMQYHALKDLSDALAQKKGFLLMRTGGTLDILRALIKETGAEAVFWNRIYTPAEMNRDKGVKAALKEDGVICQSFKANLLFEPHEVKNGSGEFYKVYSPYRKACEKLGINAFPADEPEDMRFPDEKPASEALSDWNLLPEKPDWAGGFRAFWGEDGGDPHQRLKDFIQNAIVTYKEGRDFPAEDNTSRLSPYLAWGKISPLQIIAALETAPEGKGKDHFISELLWREFSYHLLYHVPDMITENFRPEFDHFPWRPNEAFLKAWKKGLTGVPIVDAGMRQLWQTGWMHNRVRMICGSFLVKHLLQDWRAGEAWFRDTLVDCDLANNIAGWQWVAGSGADAAPYFRVFNPVLQAKKFDPDGAYVKTYIPELKDVPTDFIFEPHEAPEYALRKAGVTLGETYPRPIISLPEGRDGALAAYQAMKNAAAGLS